MLHIINYIVKIGIIIIGILLICGIGSTVENDTTHFKVMGVVFVLFGIYRIILYRMKTKQYDFSISEEDDDTNDFSENSHSKDNNNNK
jgi:Ca2+/H+ antiporter